MRENGDHVLLQAREPVGAWPRIRLTRPPRVLVVDDDPDFLELSELFLAGEPVQLVTARSADEALGEALGQPPDLIILDLKMPGADGFEILHALRAEPQTRDIPIFACSGAIDDGRRVLGAGFDAHFPKPVNWPRLRELLRQLFEIREH